MSFIDTLNGIINDLEQKYNESNLEGKETIFDDIKLLEECKEALNDDEKIVNFNFDKVFEIFNNEGISNNELVKYINEIKDVITMKKTLNLTNNFYSNEQLDALEELKTKLDELLVKLKEETSELSEFFKTKEDIDKLKELKNILEGVGKKKYYTGIDTLLENLDYENMSDEEFSSMTDLFFETRNFKVNQGLNKEELEDVMNLFKEFLAPKEFDIYNENGGYFAKLIKNYADEVTTKIDIYEAREILSFFKEKGVLERFERKALLKIALYGSLDYIKKLYEEKSNNGLLDTDAYFTDQLARLWINGSKTRKTPFRINRHSSSSDSDKSSDSKDHSLFKEISGADDEQFMKNLELLKKNSYLFEEETDLDSIDTHIFAKINSIRNDEKLYTLFDLLMNGSWKIYKNNNLFGVFSLGEVYKIPINIIRLVDLEDKIHLAIELGLLNPPMDEIFRQYDKDFELNDKFLKLKSQRGIFNNTIRNYYARNMSILAITDKNSYGYLMHKLFTEGPLEFYRYFFSERKTGQRDDSGIRDDIERNAPDKAEFNNTHFIDNSIIPNFTLYDRDIDDYIEEDKNDLNPKKEYFDKEILNDEKIQFLEENFKVIDLVSSNDEMIRLENQFLYNINGRLYSRFRVLRNASILRSIYGKLDNDMLLTSFCQKTFVKQEQYDYLVNLLEERNLVK